MKEDTVKMAITNARNAEMTMIAMTADVCNSPSFAAALTNLSVILLIS